MTFILLHPCDSKVSVAVSGEHAGRHERGQAERGATATSERLTESLRKHQTASFMLPKVAKQI